MSFKFFFNNFPNTLTSAHLESAVLESVFQLNMREISDGVYLAGSISAGILVSQIQINRKCKVWPINTDYSSPFFWDTN